MVGGVETIGTVVIGAGAAGLAHRAGAGAAGVAVRRAREGGGGRCVLAGPLRSAAPAHGQAVLGAAGDAVSGGGAHLSVAGAGDRLPDGLCGAVRGAAALRVEGGAAGAERGWLADAHEPGELRSRERRGGDRVQRRARAPGVAGHGRLPGRPAAQRGLPPARSLGGQAGAGGRFGQLGGGDRARSPRERGPGGPLRARQGARAQARHAGAAQPPALHPAGQAPAGAGRRHRPGDAAAHDGRPQPLGARATRHGPLPGHRRDRPHPAGRRRHRRPASRRATSPSARGSSASIAKGVELRRRRAPELRRGGAAPPASAPGLDRFLEGADGLLDDRGRRRAPPASRCALASSWSASCSPPPGCCARSGARRSRWPRPSPARSRPRC